MRKLRHPNLIRLLSAFTGPSPLRQQHIVMEYCSGGDLRTYLKAACRVQSLSLGEDKIWYWFVQLALGLHHMHQQRVLHRDLKTANVFLSNAGYLVLGDLGIARALTSGDMAATVIGTPLYMAPEVLEGKDYSFSSDVWALGCVLYELCTGKPPFAASNTAQLLSKICRGDYLPAQKGENLATSRLPALIASMLRPRPEARPSVDQLLRDSIVRVHVRRYCADRVRSPSMTEEERRVLLQQVAHLGLDVTPAPSLASAHNNPKEEEGLPVYAGVASYSRHKARDDRSREAQEKRLMNVRQQERREQLQFALERLHQLRLQLPHSEVKPPPPKCTNDRVNRPSPPIKSSNAAQREPPRDAEWRDPVRARDSSKSVNRAGVRVPAPLGRSNSVPKELAFTGVPRPGVPLTEMAKTFAACRPVCRDVRILRQQEAAKAAERYKRRLDVAHSPRQQASRAPEAAPRARRKSIDSTRVNCCNKEDEETTAAILQSIATLRDALA
jgi:serine/threonine protein kinase